MNNGSTLAVSLFNNLLSQYNGSIIGIEQGSIAIGKELFWYIALISVAVLGINRLLSKNVDMVESNIELIKLLIYFNVFYLFIDNFPQLLGVIVGSFKQAAFYMGAKLGQPPEAALIRLLWWPPTQVKFLTRGLVLPRRFCR